MLLKNRTVEKRMISSTEPFFKVRGNLYTIPKEAVNLIVISGKGNNPHAELIYVEGNPIPVSKATSINADDLLDKLVIENALRNTGQTPSFAWSIIGDYLKSPGKILMLAIVGIIISAVVGGFIHW